MKEILLDTNAYTRFLAGDEKVLNVIAAAEIIYMSVFVLGELFAGFKGGNKEKQNKQILRAFLEKPTVSILEATEETSEIFGGIKDALRRAGSMLPINDVWIAAHGIEIDAVIITYDGHFKKVPGVRIWRHVDD